MVMEKEKKSAVQAQEVKEKGREGEGEGKPKKPLVAPVAATWAWECALDICHVADAHTLALAGSSQPGESPVAN